MGQQVLVGRGAGPQREKRTVHAVFCVPPPTRVLFVAFTGHPSSSSKPPSVPSLANIISGWGQSSFSREPVSTNNQQPDTLTLPLLLPVDRVYAPAQCSRGREQQRLCEEVVASSDKGMRLLRSLLAREGSLGLLREDFPPPRRSYRKLRPCRRTCSTARRHKSQLFPTV